MKGAEGDRTQPANLSAALSVRQLYATYRPRLWSFVSKQLNGNVELTNTVLQDVFLGVWRAAAVPSQVEAPTASGGVWRTRFWNWSLTQR